VSSWTRSNWRSLDRCADDLRENIGNESEHDCDSTLRTIRGREGGPVGGEARRLISLYHVLVKELPTYLGSDSCLVERVHEEHIDRYVLQLPVIN
jgi:hypothetical protein